MMEDQDAASDKTLAITLMSIGSLQCSHLVADFEGNLVHRGPGTPVDVPCLSS